MFIYQVVTQAVIGTISNLGSLQIPRAFERTMLILTYRMSSIPVSNKPAFNKERHIRYWLRCLKTHLPNEYTSTDSNRMTFACFILSALDILGVLQERTSLEERKNYVDWIYHCQHPSGGFRGFTGTISGDAGTEAGNGWDPANLGGTFFALCALAVLGDGLERVKRRECLDWVTRLQVEDGSFGEVLGQSGEVEGKQDIRFAYLAASIRWILRDEHDERKDIDVEKLFEFVHSSRVRG